ncbi:hypothetical protein QBC38DRAFT_375094, partial [Podospora fimiseda]
IVALQLITVIALILGAVASPVTPPSKVSEAEAHSHLAKLAAGIHLVNCKATPTSPWKNSYAVYCANINSCGFEPSAANICAPGGSNAPVFYWEGIWTTPTPARKSCTFSSGVTLAWYIRLDAQSLPVGSLVG